MRILIFHNIHARGYHPTGNYTDAEAECNYKLRDAIQKHVKQCLQIVRLNEIGRNLFFVLMLYFCPLVALCIYWGKARVRNGSKVSKCEDSETSPPTQGRKENLQSIFAFTFRN